MADKNAERTFIMIKPDGVHRGIVGEIIKRFENKGFKLVAMKFMQASTELLENHYADLSKKPFFPGLVKYMARCVFRIYSWPLHFNDAFIIRYYDFL